MSLSPVALKHMSRLINHGPNGLDLDAHDRETDDTVFVEVEGAGLSARPGRFLQARPLGPA